MQCQVRVGWGSDFSGGGFLLFRYISCLAAFNEVFLSDSCGTERDSDRCEQVSPISTVLPQNLIIKLVDVRLSEYLQGGHLSSSIVI